jgi:glutathione synthase/RimK-type ligase-like ATP-grasp enzyme
LAFNGIQTIRLSLDQDSFWDELKTLSLFIMRFQHYDASKQQARDILPIVENELGIPCFPNQISAWQYDDKIKQYFLMKAHGYPMTKSWIFYDRREALKWAQTAEYPLVFKLKVGAGSMNVLLVKSPKQARRLITRMFSKGLLPQRSFLPGLVRFTHFNPYLEIRHLMGNTKRRIRGLDPYHFWVRHKNYVLFQKYLPENPRDTRIVTIGDRAFGYRRKTRSKDFRASGSGFNEYDPAEVDLRCVEIALKVTRDMVFQSMAYDFLHNENGEPEFCEMSYNFGWKMRFCPGYWDRDLVFQEGHQWPEHLHLVDALGIPDLKMPQMDN